MWFLVSCQKDVSRSKADDLYKQEWYSISAKHYERLYETHPTEDIMLKRMNAYVRSHQYEKAESFFRELKESDMELSEYGLVFADVLRRNGQYEESLEWYGKSEIADSVQDKVQLGAGIAQSLLDMKGACFGDKEKKYCISLDASESIDPERPDLVIQWDFDDGGSASGPAIEYCFTTPGKHMAFLNIYDPVTQFTDKREFEMDVEFKAPFELDYPYTVYKGEPVSLAVTGELPEDSLKIIWDLDDTRLLEGEQIDVQFYSAGRNNIKVYLINDSDSIVYCYEKTLNVFSRQ